MKRTIEISTRGLRLFRKDTQLVIANEDKELSRIPLEDVGMLVIDTSGITISSGVMSTLASHGGCVLFCDDVHLPSGLYLPTAKNTLHSERIRFQAKASEPLTKNIWTLLVKAKIRNQADNLSQGNLRETLRSMCEQVRSGDSTNTEASAAQFYWPLVFGPFASVEGEAFRRRRDGTPPNGLLNYGYAVLRAATARALCCAGLHPGLGVWHHNRYSGYPLADDVMEPYRPWIDRSVQQLVKSNQLEVTPETKKELLLTLTAAITIDNECGPLLHALERTASSLAKVFDSFQRNKITAKEAVKILHVPSWPIGEEKNESEWV